MPDFLVNELHDEHRDREWVDAYGFHWAWCEDSWVWRLGSKEAAAMFYNNPWITPPGDGSVERAVVNARREGRAFGPGPFMEAMHHRLLWEK